MKDQYQLGAVTACRAWDAPTPKLGQAILGKSIASVILVYGSYSKKTFLIQKIVSPNLMKVLFFALCLSIINCGRRQKKNIHARFTTFELNLSKLFETFTVMIFKINNLINPIGAIGLIQPPLF